MDTFYKIRKKSYIRECFHKDNECSSKIIRAHSIQNNKILSKISDVGEVLYPFSDSEMGISLKRQGKKSASTFTGFCGFHDNHIFKSIENRDYLKGDKEQNFLFAYRTLAKEYHAKKELLNFLEFTLDEIKIEEVDPISCENFRRLLFATRTVLDGLSMAKNIFNNSLDKNKYEIIYTKTFEFYEECHLAASSVLTPERDLLGKIINDFSKINEDINFYRFIFFTIFPQNKKLMYC
jgi:hypothetical protein